MDIRFDTYLKTLAAAYREGGTEHSGRTALESLLNAFADDTMTPAGIKDNMFLSCSAR